MRMIEDGDMNFQDRQIFNGSFKNIQGEQEDSDEQIDDDMT